jgi:hypothetical protein
MIERGLSPLTGHCYVVCEVLAHFIGFDRLKPMVVQHEGSTHWFLLQQPSGRVLDPTADQFDTPVPYDQGKGCGFLTKKPSKRAIELAKRARLPLDGSAINTTAHLFAKRKP